MIGRICHGSAGRPQRCSRVRPPARIPRRRQHLAAQSSLGSSSWPPRSGADDPVMTAASWCELRQQTSCSASALAPAPHQSALKWPAGEPGPPGGDKSFAPPETDWRSRETECPSAGRARRPPIPSAAAGHSNATGGCVIVALLSANAICSSATRVTWQRRRRLCRRRKPSADRIGRLTIFCAALSACLSRARKHAARGRSRSARSADKAPTS